MGCPLLGHFHVLSYCHCYLQVLAIQRPLRFCQAQFVLCDQWLHDLRASLRDCKTMCNAVQLHICASWTAYRRHDIVKCLGSSAGMHDGTSTRGDHGQNIEG